MHVELLAHTPEPEKVVAAAAKLCYSSTGAKSLTESLEPEMVSKFLTILSDLGHESPIEHMSFTFAIEGVSRVLTHQLVRHRMASYSQQSQRYVRLDHFEYITPPEIAKDEAASAIFQSSMTAAQKSYDALVEILKAKIETRLIAEGMAPKKAAQQAEKAAIEDARFVFPNACETKIVVTMNARSLMNFFRHRCCQRAQWEIRALATEMLKLVKDVAPNVFRHAGPSCVHGPCPEGIMTCGRMTEIRETFKQL
jgi:thymidylate synthase (FAD)